MATLSEHLLTLGQTVVCFAHIRVQMMKCPLFRGCLYIHLSRQWPNEWLNVGHTLKDQLKHSRLQSNIKQLGGLVSLQPTG